MQTIKANGEDGLTTEHVSGYIYQFAAELDRMAEYVMNNKAPQMSGDESLHDQVIMEAIC